MKPEVEEIEWVSLSKMVEGWMASKCHRFKSNIPIEIEEWLNCDRHDLLSRPLFLVQNPLAPTKTILQNWISLHRTKESHKCKDLIIQHFASTGTPNDNPCYMLFSLMTHLREALSITKQVEVEDERIRKYYEGWLKTCSSIVEKQDLHEKLSNIQNVILIIEGFGLVRFDSEVGLWLPKRLPPRIRIIVTVEEEHLERLQLRGYGGRVIEVSFSHEHEEIAAQLNEYLDRVPLPPKYRPFARRLAGLLPGLGSTFAATLCMKLMFPFSEGVPLDSVYEKSLKVSIEKLPLLGNMGELLERLLKPWAEDEKQALALCLMVSTYKGLTEWELQRISQLKRNQLWVVMAAFEPLIMRHCKRYCIKSRALKQALQRNCGPLLQATSRLIRDELNQSRNYKRLEELLFHVRENRQLPLLKELMTPIENFLILSSPDFSYELYSCWQALIQQAKVDPIDEFNKSIEMFKNEHSLTSRDIFRINMQICCFMQRFSAFENRDTPEFLHTKLVAKPEDVQELSLHEEFRRFDLLCNPTLEAGGAERLSLKQRVRTRVELIFKKKLGRKEPVEQEVSGVNRKAVYKLRYMIEIVFPAFKREGIESKPSKERFRCGYEQQTKKFLARVGVLKVGYGNREVLDFRDNFNYPLELDLYYELNERTQHYYYKRWVWIQLPWLALEVGADFSREVAKLRNECLTIEEERALYKGASEIALQAEQQKQLMLTKRNLIEFLPKVRRVLHQSKSEKDNSLIMELKQLRPLPAPSNIKRARAGQYTTRPSPFLTDSEALTKLAETSLNKISTFNISVVYREKFGVEKAAGKVEEQVFLLRKELDTILHENRKLRLKIESFAQNKVEELLLKEDSERQRVIKRIEDCKLRMERQRSAFALSEIVNQRYEKVISICKANETSNKEWVEYLNKFNNNIRRMIRAEKEELETLAKAVRGRREERTVVRAREVESLSREHEVFEDSEQGEVKQEVTHNTSKVVSKVVIAGEHPSEVERTAKKSSQFAFLAAFFQVRRLEDVLGSRAFLQLKAKKEQRVLLLEKMEQLRGERDQLAAREQFLKNNVEQLGVFLNKEESKKAKKDSTCNSQRARNGLTKEEIDGLKVKAHNLLFDIRSRLNPPEPPLRPKKSKKYSQL